MKRTLGPWTLQTLETNHNGYEWKTFAVRSKANHCLATIGDVDRATAEQNEGNAFLIAAAPELLEACKEAQKLIELARPYFPKSMHDSDKFALENVNATIGKAIAKATS